MVTVNGNRVPATTTVFAGDRVQTAENSTAAITSQGLMVQLDPNSSAIFTSRTLDLGCGSAQVTSSVGTIVRVAGIVITPAASGTTKVAISHMSGLLKVTATENWAVVHDGMTRHMLAPGKSLSLDRPGASCDVLAQTPQGSTRIYLPAAAVAVGANAFAYCSTHWFCSEVSPSVP